MSTSSLGKEGWTMVALENPLLAPYELARVLNVSISWVRTHAAPSAKNRLPTKKIGNLIRFDLREVRQWLDEQRLQEKGTTESGVSNG